MESTLQKIKRTNSLLSLVNPVLTDESSRTRIKSIKSLLDHCGRKHIAPEGLSHAFLEKMISCFPPGVNSKFQGVFTLDDFNIKKIDAYVRNPNWFAIINTVTKSSLLNGKVGHFVFFMKKNNVCYYIDPLGREPDTPHIWNQLCLSRNKYIVNRIKVQSSNSNYCGIFCLCFTLLFVDAVCKVNDLRKLFSVNNRDGLNDKRAVSYISKYIQKM